MINQYAVNIRRELHMFPELGFDLERTISLIKGELIKLGVSYTEEYGKSSIVATINPDKKNYTIGIRADMDALPIREENDVPYKSKIDGKMHACGHDAHTAILLTTLKELYEVREQINCRVKFLFQSAEEAICGAKYMAEDGVMNDIDCIIALHVDAEYRAGQVVVGIGPQNANVDNFILEFFGKASHVARQQNGADANMAAIKACMAIELMLAKEVKFDDVAIFNAGEIHGGTANNIISDYCSMNCTLRTWNDETENMILEKIKKIVNLTAEMSGVKASFTKREHYPVLVNDAGIAERVKASAIAVLGEENVFPKKVRSTGGEDFAYFAREKPGCMFRLGTLDKENQKSYATHSSKFDVDEEALDVGVKVFKQFVFDYRE